MMLASGSKGWVGSANSPASGFAANLARLISDFEAEPASRDPRSPWKTRVGSDPRRDETTPDATAMVRSRPVGDFGGDPVETALARTLETLSAALSSAQTSDERVAVARELGEVARTLEARRVARAGAVDLAAEARRRRR